MMYLGDFAEDTVVDFMWSTNGVDGASITRSTNGTVSVYKGNSATQSTAGVTDTEDFDSLTGVHHCRIDTSADAFYVTGGEYTVVLSGATVDTKSVNAVLAHFSIERSGGALALLKSATFGLSAIETLVDDLEGRLTAARAGYLDNLSGGAVALQGSVDDLEGRLTAARAGYLDNLSGGAVATAANLATVAGYLDTEIAAILADTNELQTDWVNGGRLDLLIDAIKAKTDGLPSDPADDGDIDSQLAAILAAVGALNDLSAADVNAQVVDVLATDTFGELAGVPAAMSSLKDKIIWLFMLARNERRTTASADVVRNDANSSNVASSTLSDDGTTFTRGEYA